MTAAGQRAERTAGARALAIVAIDAYVGSLIGFDHGISRASGALIFLAVVAVTVTLHELAHAAVAVVVGGRVAGIRLGFGPRLVDARPGGVDLDVRPLIVAAHVSWQPPAAVTRARVAAVSSAGLVLHAVLIALVAGFARHLSAWQLDVLVINAGALVSNLVPMRGGLMTTSGGPNDGAQLLALLAGARGSFLLASDPDLRAARQAYDAGGIAAALAGVAASGRRDQSELALALAAELHAVARYDDAAAAAAASLTTGQHAGVLSQARQLRAEALLLGDLDREPPDATRLAEAVSLAEQATAALSPDQPGPYRAAVTHTLALARLRQQRYAEAEQIGRWGLQGTTSGRDRASVVSTIGWAALRQGRHAQAEALLREALELAPDEAVTRAFSAAFALAPPAQRA